MKRLSIFFLLFLISLKIVSAATIDANLDIKEYFSPNETIVFNYTIISDTNIEISYDAYIICPGIFINSIFESKREPLISGKPLIGVHKNLKVVDGMEPQVCTAYLVISDPIQLTKEKTFVINTSPNFSFELKICEDQDCSKLTRVFIKNDDIFFDYYSSVENPTTITTLTYPDQTTTSIVLPTTIKAEQTGTYNLETTASKEGYQITRQNYQFSVIKEEPVIEPLFKESTWLYWLIGTIITLIVIAIIITTIILIIRKRKKPPQPPTQYPQYQQQEYYK